MTENTELKRLAEAAYPGPWYVENGMDQVRDNADDFVCETGEDEPINSAFIAAANPAAVLALIAENERLKAESEQAKLISRIAYNFDGYKAVLDERDQLRAEVAGLKTGYEAYEQVNAELKAENEALRANSSLVVLLPELDSVLEDLEIHGQHSDQGYRKLKDWYRKVDLACKAIDAALGQGEQS